MRSITSPRRALEIAMVDDRRASRRQLVDRRHVEVRVRAHGQRARDRRRRQHQLVRHPFGGGTLVAQGQPLMHAEAVLLVDDHQAEPAEADPFLHQRMRADDHVRATGGALQRGPTCPALHLAGQPLDFDAQRFQPRTEVAQMLFGKQFGRRHQGNLIAAFHGAERRHRRDHGFAAADIALDQAKHRVRAHEVARDLPGDAHLRRGQRERQRCEQASGQFPGALQRGRASLLHRRAHATQDQVLRQQLLEGEPLLRGMNAKPEPGQVRVRWRTVHIEQRRAQRCQLERPGEPGGNQLQPLVRRQQGQRLVDHRGEPLRAQTFGHRINRGQPFVDHGRQVRLHPLVLRMDDLQTLGAVTNLAVAKQPCAGRELLDLGATKVKETQDEAASGFVSDHDLQLRPVAEAAFDRFDHALHLRAVARTRIADRRDPGLVLVTQRQVEPEILQLVQAESRQGVGQRRTDAGQARHRPATDHVAAFDGCFAYRHAGGRAARMFSPARESHPPRRRRPWAGRKPRWSNAPGTAAGSTRPSPH